MEIRLSTPAADTNLAALESLYLDAFPPEERRPWDAIVNPAEKGCPQLRAIYAGECLAGLVTTWTLGPVLYVEHLAVDPAMRGSGIGAAVMAALIADASPLALLLEVEPESDDNPMAARRIGFYRRCGLDILPYPYIQPPYAPGLSSVPLLLMSSGSDVDPAEATRLLHTKVYGV